MALSLVHVGAFFALSLAFADPAQENIGSNKWSDRNVFVLGPLLVDFSVNGGIEEIDSIYRHQLTNCSNDIFYCASGHYVNLALPKKCEENARVGTTWKNRGITTTVLYRGKENPPLRKVITDTYLLGSKDTPNVVWTYRTDTGITGVYMDASNKSDLVSTAKVRGVTGLNEGVVARKHGFYRLLTKEAFGNCIN